MERHPSWTLTYDGYEPAQEGLRETLCALGNGYFVTRAAAPDSTADVAITPAPISPAATTG